MPNGKYNGQKLINDVAIKTAATIPNTIAKVPEMILVKYKIAIITAIIIRMDLSVVPMFFFIISIFDSF